MSIQDQIQKEVEQICKNKIEFENSDIVKKGYNKKTVSKVLYELAAQGKLIRTKSGWLCANNLKEKFYEFVTFAMRNQLKEPVHRELIVRVLAMPHLRWLTWKYNKYIGELSEQAKKVLLTFPFIAFSFRDDEKVIIKNALIVSRLFDVEDLKTIVENAIKIYELMKNNESDINEAVLNTDEIDIMKDIIEIYYTTDFPMNKEEVERFLYNLFVFTLTIAMYVDADTLYKVYYKIYYPYYTNFSFNSLIEKILQIESEVTETSSRKSVSEK
jgi:hypothetical protein